MDWANVRRIVFSSSATVYGDPDTVPVKENSRLQVASGLDPVFQYRRYV